MKINIYIVDELTIIKAIIRSILFNEKNYYIKIEPYLLVSKHILRRVVKYLCDHNIIIDANILLDKTGIGGEIFAGYRPHYQDTEFYNSIEDKLIEKYHLCPKYELLNEHSYAYSLLLNRFIVQSIRLISSLEHIKSKHEINNIFGADKDFIYLHNLISEDSSSIVIKKKFDISIIVNIINCISGVVKSVIFSISRIKFNKLHKEHYILGVDAINDQLPDDPNTYLVKNIVNKTNDLLFVFRGENGKKSGNILFNNIRVCTINDGEIYILNYYKIIYSIVKDSFLLLSKLIFRSTSHFSLLWLLIYENVRYKIFFEKFETKCFLGRDEYSFVAHIRTLELRKRNNLSLGLMHGYPPNGVKLNIKYVDFDIYYVFGSLMKDLYSKTWSKNMTVKPIGSWRLRKEYKIGINIKRPIDIVYFNSESMKQDFILQEVFKIAEYYSNRIIYFKPKSNSNRIPYWVRHFKSYKSIPQNVVIEYNHDPFKYMQKVSYAISHNSTVILECIHYGIVTFDFDVDDNIKNYTTRGFPDLCVKTSEEIINKINFIEQNKISYDRSKYLPLVNYKVENLHEIIKNDIYNSINR